MIVGRRAPRHGPAPPERATKVAKAGRDARRELREHLAAANGARIEERRGLPDGWLFERIDTQAMTGRLARLLEIEAKIRLLIRTGRKPSSESVAQALNSAHRLGLTETYVDGHREEWGPFKIQKSAPERLGALRHRKAVRIVLATGEIP
jgi:hypothetical protein